MPETLQLLTYEYVDDMVDRRTPYRAAHLEAIERSRAAGDVVIGGAAGDPPATGLIAFRGGPEVAEAFADADPYVAAGLVVSRTVRPWTVVTPLP
ncbi:YciI family protein [Patulibacter sp.]|uniref:YciI family protein n=1 Tax=Patulibacter sp. TaxID=1912859 RepID=UPI00271DB49D|nr:YciI family protein [Patulibacter sp.]MDO9408264.1 YciI family protein [Patulibacter sp.]